MRKSKGRVDRRRFLEISGAATAALVTSCGGGGAPSSSGKDGPGGGQGETDGPPPFGTDRPGPAGTDGSGPVGADGPAPGDRDAGGQGGADSARDAGADSAREAGTDGARDAAPAGAPTEADWQALASSLSGTLIRPGNALYNQARVVFNSRFDTVMPQAVARCANTNDVVAVLAFVERFGLAVTPRSGGHDFAGRSTSTGVVIDLGPMSTVQVGTGTATIGAGAKLADVYDQLIARNVCVPLGTCLSVGISGLTLGGGIGVLDRRYGLTCDNLVSAQVVTADRRVLTVDAMNEPDLFWALQGGGGGNFGVVTSFTFRTHPTQNLVNFSASFQFADAARVIGAWQTWQAAVPESTWSFLIFTFFTPGAAPRMTLQGVSTGTMAEFMPHWTQFLGAVGATPASNTVTVQSYRDTMLAACARAPISQCHIVGQTPDGNIRRRAFASSSDFFDAALPAAGIQALVQGMQSAVSGGILGQVLLDAMGGALGRVAPDATAFPHRRGFFSAEYYMEVPGGTASWSNSMRNTMRTWSSGRAYVNYMDPMITDVSAYYGANYPRLVQVKAKYDPNRLFRLPHGVPPV
jgi:FAD/FMN-containing dehydrogenase